MYKLYKCGMDLKSEGVMLISENSVISIPFDPANTDYQAYLKWLEESPDNKALPADEVTA